MLNERGIDHEYREYTREPLSEDELRSLLGKLGLGANAVLRKRDANKAGLTGNEPEDVLIAKIAENPRLLQRPIGISGDKAVVGRPVENLLSIV